MPRRIKESAFFSEKNFSKKDLLKQKGLYKKDDMREAKRLYKIFCSIFNSGLNTDYNERHYKALHASKTKGQLCVVKLRKGFDKAKHLRFLEEYLPQKNKDEVLEKPDLFSDTDVDDKFIEEYKENMTDLHYKFIISPENPKVDCKALTKTLIKRMAEITGYKFSWIAAIHTNTAHPHSHLLINGKDKNGRTVNMNNVFLTQTIREMTRQICTQMIGGRTHAEIEASAKRLPFANRYCVIDRQIETLANPLWLPSEELGSRFSFSVVPGDNIMYKRLCYLETLGFVKKAEGVSNKFYLEKDWNEKLKTAGRFSSFLKARQELLFTASGDLELFGKDSGTVSGKITKLYKMNYEESWDNAVVVENSEMKKAWFVPLYNEPNDRLLGTKAEVSLRKTDGRPARVHIDIKEWGRGNNIQK